MIITILFSLLIIIFSIVAFAFGLWVYFVLSDACASSAWNTTEGIVYKSKIVANNNCNGLPGYHYKVVYKYNVDGVECESASVREGNFRYYAYSSANKMVKKYPVGSKVIVYYSPTYDLKPESEEEIIWPTSLLEPGFNLECLYPVGLFISSLGLTVYLVALAVNRITG